MLFFYLALLPSYFTCFSSSLCKWETPHCSIIKSSCHVRISKPPIPHRQVNIAKLPSPVHPVECPIEIELPKKNIPSCPMPEYFFRSIKTSAQKTETAPVFFTGCIITPPSPPPSSFSSFSLSLSLSLSLVLVGGWLDGSLKLERSPFKI